MISPSKNKQLSCAIYTRKSTEDGLEKEFKSLDAQRESGEAYIKSQSHEGWHCLPDMYDDGGFTGGNMERPALRRLIADIESGKVDCVVVYKVDRLSRSLVDFARMLEVFERKDVAFVSVTQQFNTTNSMGRLMLNVLLSFAQFEREIISERTRDKIAAARRKGKWSGGMPLLGYDVDPHSKLIINDDEAIRVRTIYELYLENQSIMATIKEIDGRGWTNKRWTTRKGHERGGFPFTKATLFKLLTNVTYAGKLKYKEEVHEGEHNAIVSADVWQRVQCLLKRNGRTGGVAVRNKFGALLKGILRCASCDCSMTPSHSTRKGTTRYRYYVCTKAQKRGWDNCASKSIPATQIENFVVDQIKRIGHDPDLVKDVIVQAHAQSKAQLQQLKVECDAIDRDLESWNDQIHRLVLQMSTNDQGSSAIDRLADLQERVRVGERREAEIREQIAVIERGLISSDDVAIAMASFDPVWQSLIVSEQIRIVQLLVQQVVFDGESGKVTMTFHPNGIKTCAEETRRSQMEVVA